jgi:hypothetical protein
MGLKIVNVAGVFFYFISETITRQVAIFYLQQAVAKLPIRLSHRLWPYDIQRFCLQQAVAKSLVCVSHWLQHQDIQIFYQVDRWTGGKQDLESKYIRACKVEAYAFVKFVYLPRWTGVRQDLESKGCQLSFAFNKLSPSRKFASPIGWGTRTNKYFTRSTNQKKRQVQVHLARWTGGRQDLESKYIRVCKVEVYAFIKFVYLPRWTGVRQDRESKYVRVYTVKGVSYLLPSTSCRKVASSPVPLVAAPGHTNILPDGQRKRNVRYKSTLPGGQVLDRISNQNMSTIVELRRTCSSNLSTSPGGQVLDRILNQKGVSYLLPSTSCRQVENLPVPSVGAPGQTNILRGRQIKTNIRYKSTSPGGQG